jgi:hypothetical protein
LSSALSPREWAPHTGNEMADQRFAFAVDRAVRDLAVHIAAPPAIGPAEIVERGELRDHFEGALDPIAPQTVLRLLRSVR